MIMRLLLLLVLTTGTANAATLEYSFHQGGYEEDAYIQGYFAGKDSNNDGVLSSSNNEISSFSLSFSGNSHIGALTANGMEYLVFNLEYFIADNSFSSLGFYKEDLSDPYRSYFEYNGFGGRTENHELFMGLIEEGAYVFGDRLFNRTITLDSVEVKNITANNVPIPFSIYLFVSGLAILMRCNKPLPERAMLIENAKQDDI